MHNAQRAKAAHKLTYGATTRQACTAGAGQHRAVAAMKQSNKLFNTKHNTMVYEFLATGFEEVEALVPVDVLRRGGVEIKTVSMTGNLLVESSHGVKIMADVLFEDIDPNSADLLLLPGGMPGATNLNEHEGLRKALLAQNERGARIGAICAAPLVLGGLGLLNGRKATCYPGFEKYLTGATYTAELCTVDGNITTGRGPAAVLPYSYSLLEQFVGAEATKQVRDGMIYTQLMESK